MTAARLPSIAAAVFLFAAMFAAPVLRAEEPERVIYPADVLTIATSKKTFRIEIEVATTQLQHAHGLMFRHRLDPDQGMLFLYDRDATVLMWMKNTFVPLDMLFIDNNGRIAGIAANTVPLSTDIVSSAVPVRAILEVPGGTAARLGIAAGDRVIYKAFAR